MTVLSVLIGISIVLNNFFSIRITAGITISFSWLPTYIIGWYFGPIVGLITAFIIDTINFLIRPGIWFWLYAIQEPMLGFIVGLIASSYILVKQQKNSLLYIIIINQIIIISFIIISIFIVFFYTDPNNIFFQSIINRPNSETATLIKKTNEIFKWIILGFLFLYLIIVESIVLFKLHNYFKYKNTSISYLLDFLVISGICMITSVIFSFLLGPVSAIEYYKFVYNREPPLLIQYGIIYYLLPRVIKESIKTPIYLIILTTIVLSTKPIINTIRNKIQNSYI